MDNYTFEVDNAGVGQRIDLWLKDKLKHLSRNQIKTLLDSGKILVNNRRVVIAGWELESGDTVEVRIPAGGIPEAPPGTVRFRAPTKPVHQVPSRPVHPTSPARVHQTPSKPVHQAPLNPTHQTHPKPGHQTPSTAHHHLRPRPVSPAPHIKKFEKQDVSHHQGDVKKLMRLKQPTHGRMYLDVIFEDNAILVVNKPAGVLSEPKSDSPVEDIVRIAREYLKRRHKFGKDSFLRPIHRLDMEASGILVIAKSGDGLLLSHQFRAHHVRKQYLAAVEGRVEKDTGRVSDHIKKGNFPHGRKVTVEKEAFEKDGDGKPAITDYSVKERYSDATLLQVTIETGRTHQIRAHLASIGHPIIGDKIYGSRIPFPRVALHASKISFKHPVTHRKMELKCDPPRDLEQLIDQLRNI